MRTAVCCIHATTLQGASELAARGAAHLFGYYNLEKRVQASYVIVKTCVLAGGRFCRARTGGGLVQEEDGGLGDERARDAEPALLAA